VSAVRVHFHVGLVEQIENEIILVIQVACYRGIVASFCTTIIADGVDDVVVIISRMDGRVGIGAVSLDGEYPRIPIA
jgi:hypothetical protein